MDAITNLLVSFFAAHPKLLIILVVFLAVHTVVKSVVDAIASSRLQWDKTPLVDETWYEKTLTIAMRIVKVAGKATVYLAGVRAKADPAKK
mgnify:CR=1 FL=1